jgi:Leucine-rich repeat (LRR) protein
VALLGQSCTDCRFHTAAPRAPTQSAGNKRCEGSRSCLLTETLYRFGCFVLQVLDVRYCQLREVPDEVCDLQENLCTIHFDYNFVTSFPKSIGRLRGLRNLNLSKNEIKTVPVGCIEYMSGLQRLDLSQNQLRDIPQTIGINQVLLIVSFPHSLLPSLPPSLSLYLLPSSSSRCHVEIGRTEQGLRELILNNNEIDVAPRSLVALTGLVTLNLACNNLKRVPEITTLSCLRELR